MSRYFTKSLLLATAVLATLPGLSQTVMPPTGASEFKDTSMLKPPAGTKVAIIEFEDLQCPYCAFAAPIVRATINRRHIAYIHHDFIIPDHTWSREAAITARYLQDKVSPNVAEQFRLDVFARQNRIASRDDLQNFTRQWFAAHGQKMPFVLDPLGVCAKEVKADCDLGWRLSPLHPYTPTIVVATAHHWIEVKDPKQLDAAVNLAEKEVSASR